MKIRHALAAAALASTLAGCGATTDDTVLASGPAAGAWTLAAGECAGGFHRQTGNDAVLVRATYEDVSTMAGDKGVYLGDDHPLTQRAQALLDQMFAQASASFSAAATAPLSAPKVTMLTDPRPGAFTLSLPVCYDVETAYGDGPADDLAWGFRLVNGLFGSSTQPACIPGSRDGVPSLRAAVDWVNHFGGACQLTLEGDTHLALGAGCAPLDQPRTLKHLILNLPSDRILLYTGRLWRHGESGIAATLAHELGHYLQGHSGQLNTAPQTLERAYRHDQRPDVCAPADDPALADLNGRLHALYAGLDGRQPFPDAGVTLENDAAKARFARYTYELEADEIGARVATAAGIPAADLRGENFADWQWQNDYFTAQGIAAIDVPTSTPLAACKALAEAGWLDQGAPVIPNAADFRSPYQSFCFRIYNVEHVAAAAAYAGPAPWQPPQASPAWADVQAQAKALDGGQLTGAPELPLASHPPLFARWR